MFIGLYADNYKCFSGFTLELNPLSVLFGPNGSGKSTAIGLLARLRDFVTGRGRSLELFPAETLCRWDKRIEQTFELKAKLEHGDYVYRLRVRHEAVERGLNKVVEETLRLNGKALFEANDQEIRLYNDWQSDAHVKLLPDWHVSGLSRVAPRHDNKKLVGFRTALESTLILQLNPALVEAVAEKQLVEIPKPDCSDFAGWLRHISASDALVRQAAERSLADGVLPGFRAFQTVPSGDAEILECVFNPRLRFRLDELSSGQIALIILETAIAVVHERGGVLVLDEPSNFLGLPEIQPLLLRLQDSALEGRFQVILTAHHPFAVDMLAGGFGTWLEREPAGPARAHKIHVAEDSANDQAAVRVSDLVARGWISALGVAAAPPEPSTPRG